MPKDFKTIKEILEHIRKMGVDIVDFKIDSEVVTIDINKSLEKGKMVIIDEKE